MFIVVCHVENLYKKLPYGLREEIFERDLLSEAILLSRRRSFLPPSCYNHPCDSLVINVFLSSTYPLWTRMRVDEPPNLCGSHVSLPTSVSSIVTD